LRVLAKSASAASESEVISDLPVAKWTAPSVARPRCLKDSETDSPFSVGAPGILIQTCNKNSGDSWGLNLALKDLLVG
jgi:hypothetical protein